MPKRLYIIRHAKSLANQMLAEATAMGADSFELGMPDHLSPLVEEGHEQVSDLAHWMGCLPEDLRPSKLVSSTHTRTRQTSGGIVEQSGLLLPVHFDERFIEKRWGVIGGLTEKGFERQFPQEAAKRARQGDFRYRPYLGGESLRDLKKRVKPALEEHLDQSENDNLAIVTHSQVILVLRQLIEGLTEREVLALDESKKIPNCSVCIYVRTRRRLVLEHEYLVVPEARSAPPVAV